MNSAATAALSALATARMRRIKSDSDARSTVMGQKGVAVFFVRFADWCLFCHGQLVDANRHLAQFRALGISVISISVDDVHGADLSNAPGSRRRAA